MATLQELCDQWNLTKDEREDVFWYLVAMRLKELFKHLEKGRGK